MKTYTVYRREFQIRTGGGIWFMKDLLTQEQLDEVFKILTKSNDDVDVTTRLKRYFAQFRDELEAKGVAPEYLADAIPYLVEERLKAGLN